MLATEHFGITPKAEDDWFDPILDADTALFIDPFLIFKESSGYWSASHSKIIAHFDIVFELIAEGNRNPTSPAYRKAVDLLVFREPRELCLGYTSSGTSGAGGGRIYAKHIAKAIADSISLGILHIKHFEELGVLNRGIGADRISDATATILKHELVAYSRDIAQRHRIPLQPHGLYASAFDDIRKRWTSGAVELPTNPVTGGPLLFVPVRFLRDLPMLNADDWWDDYENQQLRDDLNYEVLRNVNKDTIVAKARQDPKMVQEWAERRESSQPQPYDVKRDQLGVWQWDRAAKTFVAAHPIQLNPPTTTKEFVTIVDLVIKKYALFVEEQGGWELLWDKHSKEKPERAAQLLFRGIAQHYCAAHDISLDAEVNLGRGPVDFKFSSGYRRRVHLEIKKLHNGRFWNGLEKQLPSYLKSDEVTIGRFLVVHYRDNKTAESRLRSLKQRVAAAAKARGVSLLAPVIDARPKSSASNL